MTPQPTKEMPTMNTATTPPLTKGSTAVTPAPEPKPAVAPAPETPSTPMTILTEQDAYIRERVLAQPGDLDAIRIEVAPTFDDRHRLSLPDYFEAQSYDCTHGRSCRLHKWLQSENGRWSYGNQGEWIFRRGNKNKLAVDHLINVKGWYVASRVFFPQAPKHLFSASGAVEEGDTILFFMPVKKALSLRSEPGRRSTEIVNSRVTKVKPGEVMMTGNPKDGRYYMPDAGGDEENPTGLQEGRDF